MKDLNKLSDNELMRMLKENDVYAYRQIFRRYYAMVETFVSKMLRDTDLATDVTQNVFMKAYTKHLGSLMEWNEHDCNDYKQQIIDIISNNNAK